MSTQAAPLYITSTPQHANHKAEVTCVFDSNTGASNSSTAQYVVACPKTKECAIIDPVWDFDSKSASFSEESINRLLSVIQEKQYKIRWILETHAHADHITSAQVLKNKLTQSQGRSESIQIGIGRGITAVQETFSNLYNIQSFKPDGSQFDVLFKENDEIKLGELRIKTIETPGHTPDSVSYYIPDGDAVFVGDTIFMPDYGTARCDFPGGSATMLFNSIRNKLFALPDDTRMFLCHDYPPGGRQLMWESSVKEQKEKNKSIHLGIAEADFVKQREDRDKNLPVPALLIPSIQVNIRAGRLPDPDENGVSYLRYPLNVLGKKK